MGVENKWPAPSFLSWYRGELCTASQRSPVGLNPNCPQENLLGNHSLPLVFWFTSPLSLAALLLVLPGVTCHLNLLAPTFLSQDWLLGNPNLRQVRRRNPKALQYEEPEMLDVADLVEEQLREQSLYPNTPYP